MLGLDETTFWLLVSIVVVALGGGLALLLRANSRRSPPIATASLAQPGGFELAIPPVSGPVELWVRFSVAFPYFKPSGQPMDRTFGLVVDLTIDGGRQVFGHGGRHPQGLLEFEGVVHYMTNLTPGSGASPTRFTATTMIKALPSCPRTLGGTITTTSGTALVEAHVLLERAN